MEKRTFQSRLAERINRISRKLTDNAIELLGTAQDCLHITPVLNKMGDIESRTITGASVISIIFPPFKDIPTQIKKLNTGNLVAIPFFHEKQPVIEVFAPISHQVKTGDLIIKLLWDYDLQKPIVWVFQVKEILLSFGNHSLIYQKYNVTFYDEVLPDEIISLIIQVAERRKILTW